MRKAGVDPLNIFFVFILLYAEIENVCLTVLVSASNEIMFSNGLLENTLS